MDASGAKAEKELKRFDKKTLAKQAKTQRMKERAGNFIARKAMDALLGAGGVSGLFFDFAIMALDPDSEFSLMELISNNDVVDAVLNVFVDGDGKKQADFVTRFAKEGKKWAAEKEKTAPEMSKINSDPDKSNDLN